MNLEQTKYAKKTKSGLSFSQITAIISSSILALSFLFLLCQGIVTSKTGYYPSNYNLGNLIFGSDWVGMNIGLLSAFIIMALALVLSIITIFKQGVGILASILLLTSCVLWFCTIPLSGVTSVSLGAGSICLGVFNFINALLILIAATYR